MRLTLQKRFNDRGSVLMITLFIAVMFGLFLFYYLNLVRAQSQMVERSNAWNSSLSAAEAGAEDALAQLNPGATAVVDRTANGWGQPDKGIYGPVSRSLPGGGSYIAIYTTDTNPIVYATGYVSVASLPVTLSRVVQVLTTNVPLFSVALAARGSISMSGGGISTDSFNSSDPNLSTSGQYDPSKASTNGSVASVFGPVNLGNHVISGDLYLGPTAQFNSSSNQVSGTVYNDFNIDFPDVVLPSASWLPAASLPQVINGVTYNYVFLAPGGDYTIATSGSIYVGTNANVRLKVTAPTFSPSAIRIAGTGANAGHLIIYMCGTTCNLSGNTTTDSGVAGNFEYFGLPANTSISFAGTSSLVGAIYAPEANLALNGGGSNINLIGSCIVKTVTMSGHYNFHFDEALLNNGPNRGYSAKYWREL